MLSKEQTCEALRAMGIKFERVDHPAVYNMAETERLALPHPEAEAKNPADSIVSTPDPPGPPGFRNRVPWGSFPEEDNLETSTNVSPAPGFA